MQEIDVDDWEKHTVYKTYTATSQQVIWFWKVVFGFAQKLYPAYSSSEVVCSFYQIAGCNSGYVILNTSVAVCYCQTK